MSKIVRMPELFFYPRDELDLLQQLAAETSVTWEAAVHPLALAPGLALLVVGLLLFAQLMRAWREGGTPDAKLTLRKTTMALDAPALAHALEMAAQVFPLPPDGSKHSAVGALPPSLALRKALEQSEQLAVGEKQAKDGRPAGESGNSLLASLVSCFLASGVRLFCWLLCLLFLCLHISTSELMMLFGGSRTRKR